MHDVNVDAQHVVIEVVSELFAKKNTLQRQRLIYQAIWEEMQGKVHAVDAMIAQTPSEASEE